MEGFKRWGIWGDWDNPYLTLKKSYESAQIGVFGKMFLNAQVKQLGGKVVGEDYLPLGNTEVAPIISKIKKAFLIFEIIGATSVFPNGR